MVDWDWSFCCAFSHRERLRQDQRGTHKLRGFRPVRTDHVNAVSNKLQLDESKRLAVSYVGLQHFTCRSIFHETCCRVNKFDHILSSKAPFIPSVLFVFSTAIA